MSQPPAPVQRTLTLEVDLPGTPDEVTRMLSDPAELARSGSLHTGLYLSTRTLEPGHSTRAGPDSARWPTPCSVRRRPEPAELASAEVASQLRGLPRGGARPCSTRSPPQPTC